MRGDACDPESVAVEDPPEERFRRIDKRIRSVLQHNRHLPLVRRGQRLWGASAISCS